MFFNKRCIFYRVGILCSQIIHQPRKSITRRIKDQYIFFSISLLRGWSFFLPLGVNFRVCEKIRGNFEESEKMSKFKFVIKHAIVQCFEE